MHGKTCCKFYCFPSLYILEIQTEGEIEETLYGMLASIECNKCCNILLIQVNEIMDKFFTMSLIL